MRQEVIISALLAHFIGDFVCQTNKIAAMKGKSVKGVGYHCVWIFVSYVLLMLPFGTRVLCLMTILNTVSHFGIDLLKLKLGKIKYPTGYFFVDQILHIIIICLTGSLSYTYALRNRWMALNPRIEMNLIMFIICTYVSTIVIKQLYFSFGKLNFTKNPFFERRERLLDALFCLGVILGWCLENGLGYLWLLIWTLIYFKVHQKMIIYDKRLLVTKAVFYLLFVSGVYGLFQWSISLIN